VFNGSRFRSEIAPRIADFMLTMAHGARSRRGSATPKGSAGPGSSDRRGVKAAPAVLAPVGDDR
jgi:poly(3-hydroxybutyrate) depolymerase